MTKQVEITNRDGHILRGIVNIPEDGTRFPAIVNVHGFTGNKSGYKSIYTHTARFLAEHGFASVRFDLYGNGESDGEFEDMTFTAVSYTHLFLAKNRGQVFSKEQILEAVFGFDNESNDSTIITHIKNIRAKFADYDYTPIKTVWGIGYKWEE